MNINLLLKKSKQYKWWILVLLIVIVLFLIYKSDYLMLDVTEGTPVEGVFFYGINKLAKFEEEVNPFRLKKDLLDGKLEVYNIQLSKNDLDHFANISKAGIENGYLEDQSNTWRSAELEVDGEKYNVKVKLRGDVEIHWNSRLKSYNIKMERTEYLDNMRRVRLIILEDRFLGSMIGRLISEKLGLVFGKDDFVVLKINGVVQGVYYMQENFDKYLLEKEKMTHGVVVKVKDNWIKDHPRLNNATNHGLFLRAHMTQFNYDISGLDVDEDQIYKEEINYAVNRLYQAVEDEDVETLKTFFDLDYLASFEAARLILGNARSGTGDNLRLFYGLADGKFYPLPDFEWGRWDLLQLEKGGLEHGLGFMREDRVDLLYLFLKDDEIRHLRNKKAYSYLENNDLVGEVREIIDTYLPYIASYKGNKLSSRIIKRKVERIPDSLMFNIGLIKENLAYATSYFNVVQKGNKVNLEVIPDSLTHIMFTHFKIHLDSDYQGKIIVRQKKPSGIEIIKEFYVEKGTKIIDLMPFFKEQYFSVGLDEQLYPQKRIYPFEFTFANTDIVKINEVDLGMINSVTGEVILEDDLYLQIADGNDYSSAEKMSFFDFEKKYSEFYWSYESGKLYLHPGRYTLIRDLVVPKNLELNILAGVTISIAENKSIVSYGTTNVLGTKNSPVVIKALDSGKPFGSFGVVGGRNDKAKIEWLDLSGGNEKLINGIYFLGGLSLHNVDVEMGNSLIHNNRADDGLNIRSAKVLIAESKFYNNYADQFDCDFCEGVVESSVFSEGLGEDENGDGLDFSGSKIIVKDNVFNGFNDKGVSIGEETKVVLFRNKFVRNNLGVAVKDSSHAFFIDNEFDSNKVAVNAYQKKQLFSGGRAYFYGNRFVKNGKRFVSDKISKMYNLKFKVGDSKALEKEIKEDDVTAIFNRLEKYEQ